MKYIPIPRGRILAIDPMNKGFGFVVLESDPLQLVDWGTAICRRTDDSLGASVRTLLDRYSPTMLALENPNTSHSQARRTALSISLDVISSALDGAIPLRLIARRRIFRAFGAYGASTKEEIASVLVERFSELRPKLPPHRSIYDSEDSRTAIFDALALAVVAIDGLGSPYRENTTS